eukprot:gene210-826_t
MPSTPAYPANKPADSKREEFRKYLEKAGVLDSLTRVLVELYEEPEKPTNALEHHLHGGPPETADVESLKLQVAELTQKNEELTEELEQFEPEASGEKTQES